MRLNAQPSTRPSTRTSSVLPRPGTLSISTWPSARSDVKTPRTSLLLADEDLADLAEDAVGPAHDGGRTLLGVLGERGGGLGRIGIPLDQSWRIVLVFIHSLVAFFRLWGHSRGDACGSEASEAGPAVPAAGSCAALAEAVG